MAYNAGFRTAAQLTAVARNRYNELDALMPLSSYFPTVASQSMDYEFERRVVGFTDAAEYREFSSTNAIGRERPVATITGHIPPIGRDYRFSEYARAQLLSQGDRDAVVGSKLDDLAALGAEAICRRLEQARISAVLTGKVQLAENNVYATIDYGRDQSLFKTLTGAAAWNKDTSDPVHDLETWVELSRVLTGVVPTALLLSHDVYEQLRVNKAVREGVFAGAASVGVRTTRDQLENFIEAEVGIISVVDMSRAYADARLDMPNPWPDKQAVLIGAPGTTTGSTQFGIDAHALDKQFAISAGQRPGIIANAYDRADNVPDLWVGVNAIALPVMPGVNTVVGGTVL